MFELFLQESSQSRYAENEPEIREQIHYSEEIDPMDIVSALRERGIRKVRLNLDQRRLDFPIETREAIECILDEVTPPYRNTVH